MLVYLALIAGGFLLYKGGDWLLEGVIDFGNHMGWPKAITGLLLVSLGTSAPELFVSLGAAIQGQGAIAAGNVIGSNIINTAIVLGIAATFASLPIERLLQKQLIAMMVITILTALALVNGHVSRLEGLVLLLFLCASFAYAFRAGFAAEQFTSHHTPQLPAAAGPERNLRTSALLTIGGILTLLVGAEAMIWGGIKLAEQLDVPKSIVALTITAIGTSLPEIAATVVAISKRETALAVGNVVGSNLMNLGLVLGLSALVVPLENIDIDLFSTSVFLALTFFVFVMGYKYKQIARWVGGLLLLSYVGYVGVLLL